MEITAKTDNFLKAIMKYADDQRNAMHSEVDKLKEEKIKEAEKKAAFDSEKLIKDKLEAKKNEQTGILAKNTQEGQRKLFVERVEMTENIFKKAEEKLIESTVFMKNSVTTLTKHMHLNLTVQQVCRKWLILCLK